MYPASRILWRKEYSEYLRVLSAKHDGQAIRMQPSAPQGYFFMNSSSPERISRNPHKQKGFLSISAAQLFMHPDLLCQQHLPILPLLPGGKNFMIISSTGQYILFALN
jgi:hypothetical protein